MIRIIALSIPLSCIHSCFNGYYLGLKKAGISASAQLLEQIIRVLSVFTIAQLLLKNGQTPSLSLAVIGLLAGESASTLFSVLIFAGMSRKICTDKFPQAGFFHRSAFIGPILKMAFIVNVNRIIVNLFASAETILLPQSLENSGLSGPEALSVYGVLFGMVLPLLLFPNALTGSISVMLLPAVSEANEKNQKDRIRSLTSRTFFFCFSLGILCMIFFLLTGNLLGQANRRRLYCKIKLYLPSFIFIFRIGKHFKRKRKNHTLFDNAGYRLNHSDSFSPAFHSPLWNRCLYIGLNHQPIRQHSNEHVFYKKIYITKNRTTILSDTVFHYM